MEDNKNEMSITEAIERCDIMLSAISINGAEKGFANDDNGFPDCVVMKSLIRRCKWALKRQIPMKPRKTDSYRGVLKRVYAYVCPTCGNACLEKYMNERQNTMFCWNCGQKLDWGDENERS